MEGVPEMGSGWPSWILPSRSSEGVELLFVFQNVRLDQRMGGSWKKLESESAYQMSVCLYTSTFCMYGGPLQEMPRPWTMTAWVALRGTQRSGDDVTIQHRASAFFSPLGQKLSSPRHTKACLLTLASHHIDSY